MDKALLATAIETGKQTVLAGGQVIPMFHLIGRDKKHYVVMAPWENDQHKRIIIEFVKLKVIAYDIEKVLFVSETWFRRCKTDIEALEHQVAGRKVETYDDKQEAITALVVDEHGKYETVMCVIERGETITFQEMEPAAQGLESWLLDLWPPHPVSDGLRARIRERVEDIMRKHNQGSSSE
jgi:hypothetical protein